MRLLSAAPGKVNLCLFVGAPREDGYHPLVSVVQPVSLADELTLLCPSLSPMGGSEGQLTRDEVLCAGVEGDNLAARALALYRRETGWDGPPVRLTIDKRVPVAAGMGGGSADAAAALRLAAWAAGRRDDPVLRRIAPHLGADVPSQVEPRRCLMTGIGEHVEALADGPPCALVVVPSPHALATPDVYAEADRLGLGRPPEELAALQARVRAAVARGGGLPDQLAVNDLEPAARQLCPWIDGALDDLRRAGAARALVSGSGPTCFGLFASLVAAEAAADALRARHPGTVTAEPVGPEFARVVQA